ncbi:cytochrome b561 and DOMON domain-containing protein At5g47530-like [Actinidia eriantha]|uniref:cytochrome b561 and DOMON domain-containing protein At5g47530-like n=1 Tax=Actinidia eriantha TaxID=165200 RepID=UPI00259089F2|nr:cytochrome b561 and DOMON domain-containing protein At5g47530-like [Actinidia eriantha]
MVVTKKLILVFCILTCLLVPSLALLSSSFSSSPCSDFVFPNDKAFASCTDLPTLNSFLHWTHKPSSRTLEIAYRHTGITSPKWVAWGINPTSPRMVGTQAIVAYQKPDGTMTVYTSPVNGYRTQLQEGELSFPVSDLSASFSNDEIIVFATLEVPDNTFALNHVWQDGPMNGNSLGMHDLSGSHLQSMGTLNLTSEQALASHGGDPNTGLKISHGILNTVSWGIMMPLGFMAARYLKAVGPSTGPLWFYLHIALQLPGYIIGMAGGATGLLLLHKSSGIHRPCHMGIGILLFCLGLLQVSALIFRPAKDHKYRYIWNRFHHGIGYTVLLLGFANIWIGFSILEPAMGWVIAYGVIFGAIVLSSVVLEVWKKLRKDGKTDAAHEVTISVNEAGENNTV